MWSKTKEHLRYHNLLHRKMKRSLSPVYRECILIRCYHCIANDFRFPFGFETKENLFVNIFHWKQFINPIYKCDLNVSRLIFICFPLFFIVHPPHKSLECFFLALPEYFPLFYNLISTLIEFIPMSNEKSVSWKIR